MAPSGEHRPEDLGQATVRSAAVATSTSAIALRKQVTDLNAHASGKIVSQQLEILTTQAGIAEKTAANLKIVADALQIREAAAKAWNTNAAKDSEIEAAKKAVADAKKALMDASAASGDTSAASTKLEAAQKKLKELKDKRKAADEAYDAAEKKAADKLKEIKGTASEQDSSGRNVPGGGTTSPPTGTGTGTPSPSAGAPGKSTAGGTAKPSATPATPAATPSAKPSATETKTSGDDLSGLLTQLASQQQQQPAAQAQAQPTAQATPAAATPQQTQQQPEKDKDLTQSRTNPWDRLLGSDGILDTGDLATLGVGAPLTLGGGSTPTHATPAATVTPSAPASAAPATTGLSAGTVTQPVTSGTSATGLNTSTDVSGRPAEQQRGPFSVGPETKTSGATGTGTSATSPAHSTGARPMGGGMPMMPMGAMGGPGGGGGKDREQAQTTSAAGSAESDLLHGRHTAAEAVPGGTIAQKDHPRQRGEDAA